MIRWLNWIALRSVPGAAFVEMPRKNRKLSDATARSSGPGRRSRRPRPNAYAPAGISTGPSAVVSFSATPYGMTVPSSTVTSAGTGK